MYAKERQKVCKTAYIQKKAAHKGEPHQDLPCLPFFNMNNLDIFLDVADVNVAVVWAVSLGWGGGVRGGRNKRIVFHMTSLLFSG